MKRKNAESVAVFSIVVVAEEPYRSAWLHGNGTARGHGGRSVPRRPRGAVAGGSTPRRLADRRRALR